MNRNSFLIRVKANPYRFDNEKYYFKICTNYTMPGWKKFFIKLALKDHCKLLLRSMLIELSHYMCYSLLLHC